MKNTNTTLTERLNKLVPYVVVLPIIFGSALGLDQFLSSNETVLDHISKYQLRLLELLSWLLLSLLYLTYPSLSIHYNQRKKLKNLEIDEKKHLEKFVKKGCFSVTRSKVFSLEKAKIIYFDNNSNGVNVYCIYEYPKKYLKRHRELLI